MKQHFDCIIIGAGIGGVTSAVYLKRAGKNVLLIEKGPIGGNLVNTSVVENYTGFDSITGVDLALKLDKQLKYNNINVNYEEVIDIKNNIDRKTVITTNNEYVTNNVIIATGRIPRKLGLENESKLEGRGLSYCAICDGAFYKDKEVVIVGGGNSSFEGILYLSNICKKVYVINRSEKLRADQSLIEEASKLDNIEIINNSKVTKLLEENNKLVAVEINSERVIDTNGLFIYIGLVPNLTFVDYLETENGYIVVNNKMETSVKGIYAIGDIIKKDLYQLITAASEGAIVANNIK